MRCYGHVLQGQYRGISPLRKENTTGGKSDTVTLRPCYELPFIFHLQPRQLLPYGCAASHRTPPLQGVGMQVFHVVFNENKRSFFYLLQHFGFLNSEYCVGFMLER